MLWGVNEANEQNRWFGIALIALAVTVGSLFPTHAMASFDRLNLHVEPGIVTLTQSSGRSIGLLGAISAVTNLTRRLDVQLHVDYRRLTSRAPPSSIAAYGGALVYNIDVGRVTPYLELGGAIVVLDPAGRTARAPNVVPFFGAGFDTQIFRRFVWGINTRYYPILGTELLSNPAYASMNFRVGIRLGGL